MSREITYFRGKRILVMGLGIQGGGTGAIQFLLSQGAKVTVTDLRPAKFLRKSLRLLPHDQQIRFVLGRHDPKDFLKHDLIVKNPGVRPDSPFLKLARRRGIPITSDISIFFKFCPGKIIGVTGTRGKSTTTYLIWKFLRAKKSRVFLGGNIKKSVLEFLPRMKKDDWAVLELSSFQLQDLRQKKESPQIAILTNIFRDHLNWHRSFDEYIRAKTAIFLFQKRRDYLFANPDDKTVKEIVRNAPSRIVWARLPKKFTTLVDKKLGAHYRSSVAIALAVARHFSVPEAKINKILGSFRGLGGREELVAVIHGIRFINDTTATSPEATTAAINRFRTKLEENHKLILICGGSDKNLTFAELADAIRKRVDVVILLPGDATKKLKQELRTKNPAADSSRHSGADLELSRGPKLYEVNSMHKAVKAAYRFAGKGDYVLLSPGAASFGLFLNEFDRGDQFADETHKLKRRYGAHR